MSRVVLPYKDLTKPVKQKKKAKGIKRMSDKQRKHYKWLEKTARPYLIERDGDICQCCQQVHYPHDIDHKLNKGSHIHLKEDLDNLQLLGRFPCHRRKTDRLSCTH